ncbi:SDR family NAD(P)-dependent oxidoreductase [Streptomyces sp. NPDC057376]|uniref:SDR family NAD(P)-dependent oxidoreductase n=1 Tax=unclassified Streptomyces TaxID=2593676 RepID=UPI00093EE605|nr:SDR family oxidoreductase [Streptomyces sp. CB02414]OKI86065.1 short-chain dehydrogenase [Streptomyces sp. CB02414]
MSQPLPPTDHGLLAGKVAVITGVGAAETIGAVTAGLFVAEGARVVATDISGAQDETAAELGPAATPFQADITREEEVAALFAFARDTYGRVDVLVNVAGTPGSRRTPEITVEEYDSLTSTHLLGTLLTNKHAVRAMAPAGGGAIVNFSSAASFNIDERISPAYSAAKAGVNSLTKSFAVHHGHEGIRVNAVAPGFTLSRKNTRVPAEALAQLSGKSPLGRPGTPQEQAQVAAFLASDRASFITGVVVPVDGGWTARLA